MNDTLCYIFGHKPEFIANFNEPLVQRGLWQCSRCKKIQMDAPYEFYAKRKRPYPNMGGSLL